MSYNPATGLVYIPTSTNSSSTFAVDRNFTYAPGKTNLGIVRRPGGGPGAGAAAPDVAGAGPSTAAVKPAPVEPPSPPAIGPVPPDGQRGMLVAWDPVTQKERWRVPGGG